VTVVIDVEVTLDKDPGLGVEVEGTGLTTAEELLFDGKPDLPRGATALVNNVMEVNDDGVE
jgi:hypothetical protein